ncbi:MAG: glycosyltransferase family 4 protein [Thermoproteota archaeon]
MGFAGGAELQQVLLARELVSGGYEVSFITYDHGQPDISYVEDIEIIKTYPREKVNKINSFSKFRYILRALNKAKADLYFHSAGSSGILPFFCSIKKKKFIYRVPLDEIVLGKTASPILKLLEYLDIKKANAVVVQTEFQRRKLLENFSVKGLLIKNAFPVPKAKAEKPDPPTVLWVGRIAKIKQPQIFIELAKAIPNASFEMIGGKVMKEPQLYERIRSFAKNLPNLSFHGFVPYNEIDKYFARASIFVNTSYLEGFPNTFIQAWASYVPVVSLNVDPDGVIQKERIGFCSKTFEQLVTDVSNLLSNETLRKTMGKNAREYVEKEHNIKKNVKLYCKIFNALS